VKRLLVFLKLFFILPTMFFTRYHARNIGLDGKIKIARIWSNFILATASARVVIRNTNLIPLEDGYTFISNHTSKYDGLILLAANPLDFSFFIHQDEKLPYMTPFLKLIESIRYTSASKLDDLILMSQGLSQHKNYHLYIENLDQKRAETSELDAAFLTKTAIIPVAISNTKSIMRFGFHKLTVSFCTPLHYEEYASYGVEKTLNEIKSRIDTELKQGDKS